MSLILDALRKLEREKSARDPGVLVVGSVPWGATSPTRRLLLAAGAAAVLAGAVWVGWLLRPATPLPAAAAVPAPATPAAQSRPVPTPTLPPPAPPLPAATRYEAPAAPAVRLSRPVSRPTPPAPAANTVPDPAPVDSTPERAGSLSMTSGPAEASDAPAAEAPGELRLTAISQRDGRPVAMINDRLVFEGDSFEGVRVLRIGDAEVEVEVHGQRRVLRF
jgi:hypothetical protein